MSATVVNLATVTPERVEWLWRDRLPIGKLVVIDGDPSTGKSTLTIDLAAHVSTGTPWPDGTPCSQGGVLLLSAEDGLADTIAPRLEAAGADRTNVHALTQVAMRTDDDHTEQVPPSLPRDLPLIRQVVEQHSIRLVIVDVLMAYLAGKVDANSDKDVRGVLHQIAAMAEATGCTVVLIRHLNKSGGGNALYRGGGSIGIVGAARLAFIVARDPEDEGRRIFAVSKSNLAKEAPSLAYRLEDVPEHGCARVVWEAEPVAYRAADLIGNQTEEERTEQSEAVEWLRGYLLEGGGAAGAGETIKAAQAVGIEKRTVQRARKRAGVQTEKAGMGGGWVWSLTESLPEGDTKTTKATVLKDLAFSAPSVSPSDEGQGNKAIA